MLAPRPDALHAGIRRILRPGTRQIGGPRNGHNETPLILRSLSLGGPRPYPQNVMVVKDPSGMRLSPEFSSGTDHLGTLKLAPGETPARGNPEIFAES